MRANSGYLCFWLPDLSTWNYFLKFSIVAWLQPRSPLFQVCALTTRSFLNPSTVNKMKLYRYWKSSFWCLRPNTESILDHQQRVHTLRKFISYHAISAGSLLCQVNFPMCNGLQFHQGVERAWTGHLGLRCAPTDSTRLSDFFQVVSGFLLFVSKPPHPFLMDSLLKSSSLVLLRESNTLFGTRLTENSSNFHSNLAVSHLGWSQKRPVGWIELNFPHFFQTAEHHTASFLSQRAQPAPDSHPSVHLQQTLAAFCIRENQLPGII